MTKRSTILFTTLFFVATFLFLYLLPPFDKEEYAKKAKERKEAAYEEAYVDYNEWAEGRVCKELRFMCLPESQDKSWQNHPLKDGLDTFELNASVMKRYNDIIKEWDRQIETDTREKDMHIRQIRRDFYDRVNAKKFLIEMERSLEEEFPGFWRETPKAVRYRWIRRAMNKAKRFGWKNDTIELCARLGLDFDKDSKWTYIIRFIEKDPVNNMVVAIDYIDFVVLESDFSYRVPNTRITDWHLRGAFPALPYPKRPIPKLNENVESYIKKVD